MKKGIVACGLIACFSSLSAFADMDIPVNKVTAYSGNCAGDHFGGGTTASNGDNVTIHNVELARRGRAMDARSRLQSRANANFDHANFAIAAVPQARSNMAGIFNCFFKDNSNYRGITFKAGDHYGRASNGLERYDAAHACVKGLNNMTKPATSIVVEGSCGGIRGGAGDGFTRKFRHTRRRKHA
jgi:hypothetical protein